MYNFGTPSSTVELSASKKATPLNRSLVLGHHNELFRNGLFSDRHFQIYFEIHLTEIGH